MTDLSPQATEKAIAEKETNMVDQSLLVQSIGIRLGYIREDVDRIRQYMTLANERGLQGMNASKAETVIARLRESADDIERLVVPKLAEAAE